MKKMKVIGLFVCPVKFMKGHGSVLVPFDLEDSQAVETKVWNDSCLAMG
jgi:hypothetical protein